MEKPSNLVTQRQLDLNRLDEGLDIVVRKLELELMEDYEYAHYYGVMYGNGKPTPKGVINAVS